MSKNSRKTNALSERGIHSTETILENIASIASKIEAPSNYSDYFVGLPDVYTELAKNILFFCRTHCNQLGLSFTNQHHRFVLIINLKTAGNVFVEGRRYLFKPGHALLIFPFQLHHFIATHPQQICWLIITFELDSNELRRFEHLKSKCIMLAPSVLEQIENCVKLYNGVHDTVFAARAEIQLRVTLLLYRLIDTVAVKKSSDRFGYEQSPIIDAVSKYVYEHLDAPIKISDIAKYAAVSPSHLRSVFKSTTGRPLGVFIREAKLAKSLELLAHSNLLLKQIAYQCGFRSLCTFTRTFRRVWHISPRKYRKQLALKKAKQWKKNTTEGTAM